MKRFSLLSLMTLILTGFATATQDVDNVKPSGFIVMLKNDVPDASATAEDIKKNHLNGLGSIKRTFGAIKAFTFEFPEQASDRAKDQLLQRLRADNRVDFVEADGVVSIEQKTLSYETIPTGIAYTFQGSPFPIAPVPTIRAVRIAIIDTGIILHKDLNVANIGFSAFSTRSGDWYNDKNGHGTHCAGTAAAIRNTMGVVGMAPNVQLVAVRVLDASGSGTWSGVIAGMDWVASRPASVNIKVASMSLGGSASNSIDAAVARMTAAGITVVVAAGNSGTNLNLNSPARSPAAVTITAITNAVNAPSWTNFGKKQNVYAAPGVGILSTWIQHINCGTAPCYHTISGTSMATPHVAGIVAQCFARGMCSNVDSAKNYLATCASRGQPIRLTSLNGYLGYELRLRSC
jgi:subtilisin family serine protease